MKVRGTLKSFNKDEAKNVNGFINLFQNCEIRFCFKGFPYVLGDNITEESVKSF